MLSIDKEVFGDYTRQVSGFLATPVFEIRLHRRPLFDRLLPGRASGAWADAAAKAARTNARRDAQPECAVSITCFS